MNVEPKKSEENGRSKVEENKCSAGMSNALGFEIFEFLLGINY
jgi:hypothetical protein